MAEQFRLLVRAKADGFYGDRKHYALTGKNKGHKRAGNPFAILADALRYDQEGQMQVHEDLKPILPTWVEVINPGDWKPIDKAIPHVVVKPKIKPGKRKPVDAVLQAAPEAWPANMKKHRPQEGDRVVKIKRAGVPGGMNKGGGEEEDED